ncbi:hypothetical protein SAMN06296241_1860 [Salinimicrobium sediminis]|uniref:Uncharacterized protein n=1 Tax=Salinimicrobium sediminis TaxID=1343891 RepID=A0A285X4R9_9FLAO|nr:hypothetical protein [Salinimicrobium sediminis]SOC80312.1 hypothetical protein SAMN06296241_1860 [Salinimicrobium sediminis]
MLILVIRESGIVNSRSGIRESGNGIRDWLTGESGIVYSGIVIWDSENGKIGGNLPHLREKDGIPLSMYLQELL